MLHLQKLKCSKCLDVKNFIDFHPSKGILTGHISTRHKKTCLCAFFFKLLSLPSVQQVVKADATEIGFVLSTVRLAEKLSVVLLLMFKSTPLSCDSANSQSNSGPKAGFLLVLSCQGVDFP